MNICGCVMIEKEENIFVRQNFHAEDTEGTNPVPGKWDYWEPSSTGQMES